MLVVTDAISTVDSSAYLTQLPHATAYQMSAVIGVLAIALCVHRLRTFEIGQTG